MQLHYKLATLKKGALSIADYFHTFTGLVDTLAAIGQPVNDSDALSFLLAGLGLEYDSLITSVHQRLQPPSIDELYGHLLNHELRLEHHTPTVDLSAASANVASNHRFSRGNGQVGVDLPTMEMGEAAPISMVPSIFPPITEAGGVVEILQMDPDLFVKCAIVPAMLLFTATTGLIILITVNNRLRCKPITATLNLLQIRTGTLTLVLLTISLPILQT